MDAGGISGNLIPSGAVYSGGGTYSITVLANSLYCIIFGANDTAVTIGGITYLSAGAGSTLCLATGSNTTMTFTGTGGSIVTLKLTFRGSQSSAPNAPTGFTWVLNGANVDAGWNAPPAGVVSTELWTSSDGITFTKATTVAAPGVTASVAAPGAGNTIYGQIRFCTATICGLFTAAQSVFVSTLLTGIVSYWKLDEAANVTRVDSAGANNLTDGVPNVGSVAGQISNCAVFTNVNAACRLDKNPAGADLIIGPGESLSISCWFYIQGLGSNRGIVTMYNGAIAAYFLWMNAGTGGIDFLVTDAGAVQRSVIVWPIGLEVAGTWHHVVCGFDRANNQIFQYFDGGARVNAACVGAQATGGQFSIGNYANLEPWQGRIDEVGIWKRVLSAAEAGELWNAGAGKTYPFT